MQQYEFYSTMRAKYQQLLMLQYKYFLDKQRKQQRPSSRAKNLASAECSIPARCTGQPGVLADSSLQPGF
jgi:hypothetical protein